MLAKKNGTADKSRESRPSHRLGPSKTNKRAEKKEMVGGGNLTKEKLRPRGIDRKKNANARHLDSCNDR